MGATGCPGGGGRDRLSGGAGADVLHGGPGDDHLDGGPGDDHIHTGSGRNVVLAESGDDVVDARNGRRDVVDCGRGRDTVRADRQDVLRGCERVIRGGRHGREGRRHPRPGRRGARDPRGRSRHAARRRDLGLAGRSLTIAFAGTATGATAFSWDFGDGGASTEQNPTHVYGAPGDYAVTLTASDDAPPDASTTATVHVDVAPTAAFVATQVAGTLNVAFTNASTGAPTGFAWDFGDASQSTQASPTHAFPAAGTYTVRLTATNPVGTDTVAQRVTVVPPPPRSSFKWAACRPAQGRMASRSPTPRAGRRPRLDWNFGDANASACAQSAVASPTHVFAEARRLHRHLHRLQRRRVRRHARRDDDHRAQPRAAGGRRRRHQPGVGGHDGWFLTPRSFDRSRRRRPDLLVGLPSTTTAASG